MADLTQIQRNERQNSLNGDSAPAYVSVLESGAKFTADGALPKVMYPLQATYIWA